MEDISPTILIVSFLLSFFGVVATMFWRSGEIQKGIMSHIDEQGKGLWTKHHELREQLFVAEKAQLQYQINASEKFASKSEVDAVCSQFRRDLERTIDPLRVQLTKIEKHINNQKV